MRRLELLTMKMPFTQHLRSNVFQCYNHQRDSFLSNTIDNQKNVTTSSSVDSAYPGMAITFSSFITSMHIQNDNFSLSHYSLHHDS